MKRKYNKIVRAIFKMTEEEGKDYRNLVREWIMLFEKTRVVGWNRDEFLGEVLRVLKENRAIREDKNGKKNIRNK